MIAKLTLDGDLILDISNFISNPGKHLGEKILDMVSLPLLLLDNQMNIIFSNQSIQRIMDVDSDNIQQLLDGRLERIGIEGITFDVFQKMVSGIFNNDLNSFEIVELSPFSYIVFAKITIFHQNKYSNVVLIGFRGERKQ